MRRVIVDFIILGLFISIGSLAYYKIHYKNSYGTFDLSSISEKDFDYRFPVKTPLQAAQYVRAHRVIKDSDLKEVEKQMKNFTGWKMVVVKNDLWEVELVSQGVTLAYFCRFTFTSMGNQFNAFPCRWDE